MAESAEDRAAGVAGALGSEHRCLAAQKVQERMRGVNTLTGKQRGPQTCSGDPSLPKGVIGKPGLEVGGFLSFYFLSHDH